MQQVTLRVGDCAVTNLTAPSFDKRHHKRVGGGVAQQILAAIDIVKAEVGRPHQNGNSFSCMSYYPHSFSNIRLKNYALFFRYLPIMKKVCLCLIFALLFCKAEAQKVGVVLSGGGAKGLAHIGLLKALEDNNIPIDYICGTSMGAIVGSLYAIGYSPEQMGELLSSEEFLYWSTGKIPIEDQVFYKTRNFDADLISMDFEKNGKSLKPLLPTSFISPEQMDFRFMQIYANGAARANYDFSKLFVPFFCVASDVHNNKPHIFTKGNLGQAVRASMTFPGYFKPIMVEDSVLLFDGGMQNNFPIDILDTLYHPDIVIGCNVAENPETPTSDDVYLMLMNVFMKQSNLKVSGNGILISPKVSHFGMMDFNKYNEIQPIGYEATMAKMDSIKTLVSRRANNDELAERRREFTKNNKNMVFGNVIVDGVENLAARYVAKYVSNNRDTFSFSELEKGYFGLTSDKILTSIYPQSFYDTTTHLYNLHLSVKAKNLITMKFGGNLASGNRSFGQIGIDYHFLHRNIYTASASITAGQFYSSANAMFRIDMSPRTLLASLPALFTDFRVAYNRWNYFKTTNELFFDSEDLSQVYHSDEYFGVDLGTALGNRGVATLGAALGSDYYEYFHTTTINKSDNADETEMRYFTVKMNLEYNTLNHRQYANKGMRFYTIANYITGTERYSPGTTATPFNAKSGEFQHQWFSYKLSQTQYFDVAKHFSFGYQIMLNLSSKPQFANSISSLLTANVFNPFPQSQSQILEKFRANKWIGVGIMPVININEQVQLRSEIHMFQPYKYTLTTNYLTTFSEKFPQPRFMAEEALVWHTPIGPLAITGSYYYKEEEPWRFQINLGFLLFNRRGTE